MLRIQQWAKADKDIHKPVLETVVLARAAQTCIDLHVADWVTAQQEDPILKTVIKWIFNQKVQDLKYLLGDDTKTEEGKTILQEWKKLTLYQGALYHHHTPSCKLEEVLQIVVPSALQVAAMNGCHQGARHLGQQQMLCLLHDQFWWPGMAAQMQKVISSCERCIQHEGGHTKAPMQLIIFSTPLDLLHVDFTSIETMMELYQSPNVVNLLVFCDHFMKHIMAYVTPDQTAKTVTKFLWQGYILIFGALAKLLSDQGTNFESNIIRELCKLMSIWKVRSSPYHAQTNGQVECTHHMLMCMIGNLVRTRRQTGQSICLSWCMLTTL